MASIHSGPMALPESCASATGNAPSTGAYQISADHTTFLCHDDGKLHRFGRELFLIDGAFPGADD
jgi:hypothetical protein